MSLAKTLLLPVLASAIFAAGASATCEDVHVFLARGNGESYPGRVGAIADTVCDGISSCDSDNILFDSTLTYCEQVSDGVASGLTQIADYAAECPSSKIVLAGYSLGAQIMGDILGGGSGEYYGICTETTSEPITNGSSSIAAVVIFGNTRHVANQVYNVGNGSADNGEYPRSGAELTAMNTYSGLMQDYCFDIDPICALGDDGLSHTMYMEVYADQAGAFVQALLGYAPAYTVTSTTMGSTITSVSSVSTTASSSASSVSASTTGSSSSVATGSGSLLKSSGSSSSSSASVTSSSSSSSSTSSVSVNPATFSVFEFSNTATVATTSTFVAGSYSITLSLTSTWSTPAAAIVTSPASTTAAASTMATTTAASSVSSVGSNSTASSSAAVVTGGAFMNTASFSLSLITLAVIKVLAF